MRNSFSLNYNATPLLPGRDGVLPFRYACSTATRLVA